MSDSTDNARGPERIFAWKYSGQHTEGQWRSSLGACPTKGYVCCEYIRADLAPDPLADPRVKALVGIMQRLVGEYADDAEFQARFAHEYRSYEEADQAQSIAELWRNALAAFAAFEGGKAND